MLRFFDRFWKLFSRVHVFLSPLTFPMGIYIYFLVLLEYTSLPPWGAHWRNSHIRHLGYVFPSSLVVSGICFLILLHIYLLYLCCSEGPSHSVRWSLFEWVFFVGLVVYLTWLFGDRRTHTGKRSMPPIECTIFPFLVYKDVVCLYFTIVRVRLGP